MSEFNRAFELSQEIGPDVDQLLADYPDTALHRELKLSSLMTRATAYAQSNGQPETARDFYREAIAFAEDCDIRLQGTASVVTNLSRLHGNIALLLNRKLNAPSEAEIHYRKQVELARRLTRDFPQDPRHRQTLAESFKSLAEFLQDQGNLKPQQRCLKTLNRSRTMLFSSILVIFPEFRIPEIQRDIGSGGPPSVFSIPDRIC